MMEDFDIILLSNKKVECVKEEEMYCVLCMR